MDNSNSNLYRQLKDWKILQDPLVKVGGMRCTPYVIATVFILFILT